MTTALACPFPVREEAPSRVRRRCHPGPRRLPWLLQIHETLLGRRTPALARRLHLSQRWSAERLCDLQFAKLRRLVRHAAACCPYYRDLGLPPIESLRGPADLAAIELLTRERLRTGARRMCWQGMPAKRLIDFTRGTTDERIAYYWDRRRQAWDKANRLRGHGWHAFSLGDRELHLWPVDPPITWTSRVKDRLRARRDRLFGDCQIDSLHAFRDRLALTWQAWRRFDPARVTAYPSSLARLIRDGRRVGCRLGNRSLRRVFLTGEVTFPWQRRLIEAELGVPTVQTYGVQEAGALAFACERGLWHVSAESVLIEIIHRGRPAARDELGEVVVTGLESLAMPVLRYCTGDIVRAGPVSCACGRGLPVMPAVLGRAADFLESANGRWIEPGTVVASLGEVLEDGGFQVFQRGDGGITVHVVPSRALRGTWEADVEMRIRKLVGRRVPCVVRRVSTLRLSMFGKCRYVFSERTRRGLAQPMERTPEQPCRGRQHPTVHRRHDVIGASRRPR